MNPALYVAWRSGGDTDGRWGPIGRLEYDQDTYVFSYTKGAQRLSGFKPLVGMPDLHATYQSAELFPIFANRLLSRSRREYDAYLRWSGFDPDQPPDPISILGVTEGRRQTDAIELFPCPLPDGEGCYLNKFFVHGVRWMPDTAIACIGQLRPGDVLGLMPDFSNPHDPNAVALRTMTDKERYLIGYVPRYLAHDVRSLLRECDPEFITVIVERVNPDAPLQHRLLCRMRACWPEGFQPCRDEAFDPIDARDPAVAA